MKTYEMTREIFDKCSGNQMKDILISEVQVEREEDLDEIVKPYTEGTDVMCEKYVGNGVVTFEIVASGIKQRISFSE
ncbi:MAG: hypothetical protein LBO63_02680 [Oscillospiraceae bacterium]|jgi:hypothetical protein|nr:hypothetical protein [Oscillospiraceae bacterium]